MVKLNKIYTRTGDDGTTGLGDGQRVHKDHARVTAYGEVDEANAAIGAAIVTAREATTDPDAAAIADVLLPIQHDLFDVGADLCVPKSEGEDPEKALRVAPAQVERLEGEIDRFNEKLAPLSSFVLPGGNRLAVDLHLARTVVRRGERAAVRLADAEPGTFGDHAIRYLNRLSDLLFVLARVANDQGRRDVLWEPGANRGSKDGASRDQ
jgi:cob(I)alamin adenosyltransferase